MKKKIKELLSKDYFLIIILLVGILFLYSPSLNGKLFFDDEYFIIRNKHVQDLTYFPELFTTASGTGAGHFGSFYRPFQFVAYLIIYQFFNITPWPYHLLSMLLHFGAAVCIFFLFRDFNISRMVGFFAALFFAVHPANTQAVSYISGLGDPLGLFLLLAAFLVYRKDHLFNNKFSQYTLFAFLIILSFFSKERSAIFLALFIITDFVFPKSDNKIKNNLKENYVFYLIGGIITFFYFILRIFLLNFGQFSVWAPQIYLSSLMVRFYSFLYAFFQYLQLIFFPSILYSERPFVVIDTLFNIEVLFSLLVIGILTTLLIFKFNQQKYRPLFFGFLWFMLALIPTSGIIVMGYTMKEHWIYYSLVGFSLAFTFYFFKMIKNKKIAISIFLIIVLLLGAKTFTRNFDWSDPKVFFQDEIKYNPYAESAIANLAYEYYLEGNIDSAAELYRQGIQINESRQLYMFYYNLGYMYYLKGNTSAAIPLYKKSLEIDPNYIYAIEELIKYYGANNDTKNFIKYSSRLLQIQERIY